MVKLKLIVGLTCNYALQIYMEISVVQVMTREMRDIVNNLDGLLITPGGFI